MDDLLLAALRRETGAALAFSNGWRYGAPVLPGPVTRNDLYDMVPMDPEVMTVTLTGAEVLGMLEQNLERTFACDPFGQMGGYVKRCQGLVCYVKVENPPGHRVQACWAGGRRLDPGRTLPGRVRDGPGRPRRGRHRTAPGPAPGRTRRWSGCSPTSGRTGESGRRRSG